jgi:hypothetical protein
MKAPRARRRALHVGIAIDDEGLVVAMPREDTPVRFACALPPRGAAEAAWPDLAAALTALREACLAAASHRSRHEAVLHVALLPPLDYMRRIHLPGLRLAEARQVCRREPSRFLPVAADEPSLELELVGTGRRQRSPFTFVAAPASLIEGIGVAARESGWRVAGIVPAEQAWATGAATVFPPAAQASGTLVVPHADRVEIIGVQGRRVAWLRRLPAGMRGLAPVLLQLLERAGTGPVAVLGAGAVAEEVRELLARAGFIANTAGDAPSREEPATLAARFVRDVAGPALLPAGEQREIRRGAVRRRNLQFAAAAAVLVAAGGLASWRAAREAEGVADARARLRPAVAQALAQRDSLASASARVETLQRAVAGAPRWSALIASLSTALPDDAFLISMHVDGDSLRLEGSAAHSAVVFDAMREVHALGRVTPEGPIRQEVRADGEVRERFTLSAPIGRVQ